MLSGGQAVLRNDAGAALAVADLSSTATVAADAIVAGAAARTRAPVRRSVTVHRAAKIRGTLRAWVCPVNTGQGRAPLPCTKQVAVRGASARLDSCRRP